MTRWHDAESAGSPGRDKEEHERDRERGVHSGRL